MSYTVAPTQEAQEHLPERYRYIPAAASPVIVDCYTSAIVA
jgi:hypothetical protein